MAWTPAGPTERSLTKARVRSSGHGPAGTGASWDKWAIVARDSGSPSSAEAVAARNAKLGSSTSGAVPRTTTSPSRQHEPRPQGPVGGAGPSPGPGQPGPGPALGVLDEPGDAPARLPYSQGQCLPAAQAQGGGDPVLVFEHQALASAPAVALQFDADGMQHVTGRAQRPGRHHRSHYRRHRPQ